jgi:hypothetical protein
VRQAALLPELELEVELVEVVAGVDGVEVLDEDEESAVLVVEAALLPALSEELDLPLLSLR